MGSSGKLGDVQGWKGINGAKIFWTHFLFFFFFFFFFFCS